MPSALVLYHYFHPDDVVSAIHFSELAGGLSERGWDVTALPSNRGCRDELVTYPSRTDWQGVKIRRVWRPRWRQASTWGRLGNLAWMLAAWSLAAFRYQPDVVIVGTDPILSLLTALPWKLVRPRTKVVHWCFDLYPDAAIAGGVLRSKSLFARAARWLMRLAYARCDLIVDIGECMRARIRHDTPNARFATLTPWALAEPAQPTAPDPAERRALFRTARLGLLYSGNLGRAHCYERTLSLARRLRDENVEFTFSVRGNAEAALRSAVNGSAVNGANPNVHLHAFVAQDQLEARLGAADIHVVTLRDEWTGAVVPSKFFGALAVGRPVLFEGAPESAVAQWIQQFNVGWLLTAESEEAVAAELSELSRTPAALEDLFQRCHQAYTAHFSKQSVLDAWDRELRALL
ncbi:MAG TPA: glycosyltransferase family 4 protein [Bryobacteraceae bacterium]|nr:glycosyltransferase family 4 protein [Bryobacteraceae bacterium]